VVVTAGSTARSTAGAVFGRVRGGGPKSRALSDRGWTDERGPLDGAWRGGVCSVRHGRDVLVAAGSLRSTA